MARCTLDVANAKFQALIGDNADLQAGLKELQTKLARDHKLSSFFSQPMKGHPDYQNKIWKWDFAPEGDRSSTRKGWRLFAYVENPNSAEPIQAIPFLVYEKPGPTGNPPKYLAKILRQFLVSTVKVGTKEAKCRRQLDGDKIIALCNTCFETVIISTELNEVEIAEDIHECTSIGS